MPQSAGNLPSHVSRPRGSSVRGIEGVEVAALVERRERAAGVHDDVGARRVLHARARAPAVGAERLFGRAENAAPQGVAGGLLGLEPDGADEAVAVVGAPVVEVEHVEHAVAVERVVQPVDRRVDRVLGVAQVDAVEIVGDLADHVEIGRVVLDEVRPPRAGAIRVIVVGRQRRRHASCDFDVHDASPVCGPTEVGAEA